MTARSAEFGKPGRDEYPAALQAVLQTLTKQVPAEAGCPATPKELEAISSPRETFRKRRRLSFPAQLLVFRRDGFCCRYCKRRVIFVPTLQLIGRLYPDVFPFNKNWRGGETHPAVILCSAVVDHEVPVAGWDR